MHTSDYEGRLFVLDEARRYKEYLDRKDVSTKAEITEIFGVSRARITQYQNLLKLPKVIIQFLEDIRGNFEVASYITERKLRPLTWCKNVEDCVKRFLEIISAVHCSTPTRPES